MLPSSPKVPWSVEKTTWRSGSRPAGSASASIWKSRVGKLRASAEAQAAPLIEQFLAGRRRLETAAAEVKRLRELATIEYLGEFKRGH